MVPRSLTGEVAWSRPSVCPDPSGGGAFQLQNLAFARPVGAFIIQFDRAFMLPFGTHTNGHFV